MRRVASAADGPRSAALDRARNSRLVAPKSGDKRTRRFRATRVAVAPRLTWRNGNQRLRRLVTTSQRGPARCGMAANASAPCRLHPWMMVPMLAFLVGVFMLGRASARWGKDSRQGLVGDASTASPDVASNVGFPPKQPGERPDAREDRQPAVPRLFPRHLRRRSGGQGTFSADSRQLLCQALPVNPLECGESRCRDNSW